MRTELSDVNPFDFLTEKMPPWGQCLRTVVFSAPVSLQVIGTPPQLFWIDPSGKLWHVGRIGADELSDGDLSYFLARKWPGVTFLAPAYAGGPLVPLVDCRPPQSRGPIDAFAGTKELTPVNLPDPDLDHADQYAAMTGQTEDTGPKDVSDFLGDGGDGAESLEGKTGDDLVDNPF